MKAYTDAELEAMLATGESELVEWKPDWKTDSKRSGSRAICAFSNDFGEHEKPGVLFVGVSNDGMPSGLNIDDDLLQKLSTIKLDGRILPIPSLTVEKRHLLGSDMAVVTVQPSEAPPVRYDGRIYIRIGPCCSVASVQDEKILCEKRLEHDLPFDIQTVRRASLEDLNKKRFEEYVTKAIAPDVLEELDRTYAQNLAVCNMVNSPDMPEPTVLGILSLSENPTRWIGGAYVQFVRIDGQNIGEPIKDQNVFTGPVSEVIPALDMVMRGHNRAAMNEGPIIREIWDYPPVALEQITRNAMMHRQYDNTNAPVLIYWFNDRIEISNPGGPFGRVNIRNFGEPHIIDYRNKHLSDVFCVLRYVHKFGTGIPFSRKAMEENGNPPIEFDVQPESVRCILRKTNTERDA